MASAADHAKDHAILEDRGFRIVRYPRKGLNRKMWKLMNERMRILGEGRWCDKTGESMEDERERERENMKRE